jgi:P-type Cu2+ transporter
MDQAICLHCEAPVSIPGEHTVVIDGKQQPICCEACEIAAQTIIDKGLLDFYRFRDDSSATVTNGSMNLKENSTANADSELARWTGYDRPALQKEFVVVNADGTRTAHLLMHGVRCAACSWLIERGIATIDGVESIAVNPVTTRTDIQWEPKRIRLSQILGQIACLGFTPYPHTEDEIERVAADERRKSLKRLIVAGLGMMQVATYAVALYAGAFQGMDPAIEKFLRLISLLVATPIVLYSGAPFFRGAWHDLQIRNPGMDVPVALAIGAAYAASVWNTLIGHGEVYFDSATMFVFLLSIARHLEMVGRHRVLGLSDALARHLPRVATRLVDGEPREVGVMELVCSDLVLVNPGQTFPADGHLEGNDVQVDEALLTGESQPILKSAGDRVVAGAVNQRIAATFRVDRVGAATSLAQINHLMMAAQKEKPPIVQIANRVASRFVTGVLLAAIVVGTIWWIIDADRAFEIVLALLVVTCPCALALATPAALTVATSVLARRGFLIRRPGALEELNRVTDIVFDKTGTLTDRNVMLRRTETFGAIDEEHALQIAAAMESRSEHPIAAAFSAIRVSLDVDQITAVPGEGLEGFVGGRLYRIGTLGFVAGLSAQSAPQLDESAQTARTVCLGDEEAIMARFELAEAARSGAAQTVAALFRSGITPMIASGDRESSVRAFAEQLGIEICHAELKPADKLLLVRKLQDAGQTIAMVGDGINDSPVLAGANISIAMGSGTSLAQHSADCVMMSENLTTLIDAFAIARQTISVVRQNLIWAVCYNIIALPLAATGMLAPWMAALGMSASSLLVTANALRLNHARRVDVVMSESTGLSHPRSSAEPA